MKVEAKISLDINELDAGDVVVQVLKREHARLVRDCEQFLNKEDFTRPQAEDFKNNAETAKAMEDVLSYYMEHWAYNTWASDHSLEARIRDVEIDD